MKLVSIAITKLKQGFVYLYEPLQVRQPTVGEPDTDFAEAQPYLLSWRW